MSDSFLIDAWQFDEAGARPLTECEPWQEHAWYHCQRDAPELGQWLQQQGLNAGLVDVIVTEQSRPRFQVIGENTFLFILRGANLNHGQAPDDMLSLRLVFCRNSLISVAQAPFKAIADIQQDLRSNTGPNTIAQLLYCLIENIHERIDDVIDEAQSQFETLHEMSEVIDRDGRQRLTQLHRGLLKLNRFLKPQSLAIAEFCGAQEQFFASQELVLRGHNQRDVIFRLLEHIESLIEQMWMLREHFQQVLAETMNKNTYRLSVIAGVFLPLSFITGLLGVNIGGIPGSDFPYAFELLCALLVIGGIAEYAILRKLRFL